MKKLFTLIAPVLFLMFACNNKPTGEPAIVTQDTVVAADTTAAVADTIETTVGDPTMTAMVFEDATANPVSGATVVAKEGTKTVETVNTDEKGNYVFGKLTTGKTYTLTASKTGFANSTATVLYENANSLPKIALKVK